MDLKYDPENPRRVRDGMRVSELAKQRPALVTIPHGHESYQDFDARHTLRGGHFTEGERSFPVDITPPKHFEMDEQERCERMNQQLRRGHNLDVRGDAG